MLKSNLHKKYSVFFTLIMLIFVTNIACAFDLDMTVDDDIRKNYNPNKLIKDTAVDIEEKLPELPSITDDIPPDEINKKEEHVNYNNPPIINGNIKIKDGTVFKVLNSTKITDYLRKGSTVKFSLPTAYYGKNFTIPASTTFTGEVLESHQPQFSANGGLVVIRIRSMNYKGRTVPLNAYVIRANSKKVFLNNIKGERKYLKTMWNKGNWGRSLFGRMFNLTLNLGGGGSTILLSPFPFAYGTICLGLNTIISPVTAFFSKGGHVSVPAGSEFRIKLLDDAYID